MLIPGAGFAEEPAGGVLDWETGAGKSYVIPALELSGFVVALAPDFDKDPVQRQPARESLSGKHHRHQKGRCQ